MCTNRVILFLNNITRYKKLQIRVGLEYTLSEKFRTKSKKRHVIQANALLDPLRVLLGTF